MAEVLKADASAGSAWVQKALPSPQSEVWLTCRVAMTAAQIAAQAGQNAMIAMTFIGPADVDFTDYIGVNSDPVWDTQYGVSAVTPTPNVKHKCELRHTEGGACQLYIDDDLVVDAIDTNLAGPITHVGFGLLFPSFSDPDNQVYIDDVKFGTTRGGDDLGGDDFEDGTLDYWTTFGDVSVIDDPFPGIPPGISIALDDGPLEENPVWTRLDTPTEDPWRTIQWEITGPNRSKETDKPGTSSATVTMIDRDGTWDLTNPFSTLAGKLIPGKQMAITLPDSTGAWHWRYRGIVDDVDVDIDVTGERATVKLELIDLAAYLAQITMRPGTVGDDVPPGSEGFIYFNETADDDPLEASSRMHAVADAYGIPLAFRNFFTGNVLLQATSYGRDESALDPIIDASDAEFPGVGIFFTTKAGILAFRGRKARFVPEDYQAASDLERSGSEQVCFWSVGSMNVLADDPDVVVCTHLGYRLSRKDVINDAMPLPANVDASDLGVYDTNHIEDTDSKAAYGTMTLDAVENLQVLSGEGGTTALEETAKMGRYWVDNYAQPRVRITSISFVSRSPGMNGWAALQDFLAGVDISDVVTVTTRHFSSRVGDELEWPSSFGFAADYFVEGIQMSATPDAQGGRARVTATLDVSPRAFYDTDPWGA